jgi:putative NADH-flavin reductase
MKIALIGATGNIGSAIAQEALRRKHAVTGITRRTSGLPPTLTGIEVRSADVLDQAALTAAVEGHDVLASAFGPGADAALIVDATRAIVAAARAVGIKRVIVVGGAGSLEIGGGKQLVDSPNFPAAYRSYALAHREALAVLRDAADLNWTFFAPAAEIGPGDKVGKFRVSVRSLIADEAGRSAI